MLCFYDTLISNNKLIFVYTEIFIILVILKPSLWVFKKLNYGVFEFQNF